jgi:hypothetical protein
VRRIAVQCGPSDHLIRKRSRVRVLDRRSRAAAPLVANTRCAAVGRSRPGLVSAPSFALLSRQQLFRFLQEDQWTSIMPELSRVVHCESAVGRLQLACHARRCGDLAALRVAAPASTEEQSWLCQPVWRDRVQGSV